MVRGAAESLGDVVATHPKSQRRRVHGLWCWFGQVYGFEQHKGYGTKAHMAAIYKHGPCKEHRWSFNPVKSGNYPPMR